MQSCHLLLVAAQRWRAGFHLTGAYFGGTTYIMSILKNHTRTYFQVRSSFQGNRVPLAILTGGNSKYRAWRIHSSGCWVAKFLQAEAYSSGPLSAQGKANRDKGRLGKE